ncbi:MAG: hypothetical protein HC820_05900 [Hydrococcus sp. RM1_1_31]|nr:hypothetical protein [Hydrococcus sp. RM1_1_31]
MSGLAEIVPAIMLLHRRTRIAGLAMLTFVMLHVLTINIGFDISVKLYSLFLLYLILLSLLPYFSSLLDFFFRGQNTRLGNVATLLQGKSHIKMGLKFFVIGMIFIEALKFPISTGYLSDDDVPRSQFHGAYEMENIVAPYYVAMDDPYIIKIFYTPG